MKLMFLWVALERFEEDWKDDTPFPWLCGCLPVCVGMTLKLHGMESMSLNPRVGWLRVACFLSPGIAAAGFLGKAFLASRYQNMPHCILDDPLAALPLPPPPHPPNVNGVLGWEGRQ